MKTTKKLTALLMSFALSISLIPTTLGSGNVFLITKTPDQSTIEVGEEVEFTVVVANRTNDTTLTNIDVFDDFPQEFLRIESVTGTDVNCSNDSSRIECYINSLGPNESRTIVSRFTSIKVGNAVNTVSVNDDLNSVSQTSASVIIENPEVENLTLTSGCNGTTIKIGDQCALTVIAEYKSSDSEDVSQDAAFLNFQNIGKVSGAVFTATDSGSANINALFEDETSNSITITVVEDLGVATDKDGNQLLYFPARTSGGNPGTSFFGTDTEVGDDAAAVNGVARNNRLVLSGLEDGQEFTWFLEDKNLGTLSDFVSGNACANQGQGQQCQSTDSVLFESKDQEGEVVLEMTDSEGDSQKFRIVILKPAIKDITILSESGEAITETSAFAQREEIRLTAKAEREDGTFLDNAQGEIFWEFSHSGEEFTQSSSAGTINGGVLKAFETGVFRIRATRTERVALAGTDSLTQRSEEIISDEVAIQVQDAVPFVDSLRLQGGGTLAQGSQDTLFVRIRHFGTLDQIGDIELNLLRGEYNTPEEIPENVQHFFIEPVSDEIIRENPDAKTVLLQIPFEIPYLEDLKNGTHTLELIVNNQNGEPDDDIARAVLPVFIGTPQDGDTNLDGILNAGDLVLALRFAKGTATPTSLQITAARGNDTGKIELRHFIALVRDFFKTFVQ